MKGQLLREEKKTDEKFIQKEEKTVKMRENGERESGSRKRRMKGKKKPT